MTGSAKGHIVLWVRPYFYPDVSARIDQLFKALAKVAKRGVCLVQDDPYVLGSVSLKELGAVARSNDVPAKFLVGMHAPGRIPRTVNSASASWPGMTP